MWILLDQYKVHGELNQGVRTEQLYTLKYPGDDKKEEFARAWMVLIEDGDCKIDDPQLRQILYGKLKGSTDLEHDIKYFERCGRGHPDYTHDYLVKCLWNDINRKKEAKYELEYNTQMGSLLGAPPLKGGVMDALQAHATPGEVSGTGGKAGKKAASYRSRGFPGGCIPNAGMQSISGNTMSPPVVGSILMLALAAADS